MKLKPQPDSAYDDIFSKAAPYLDTRKNDILVSLSCDFGCRLLALYPKADQEVVLPGIVLHDLGWKMVPEEKQIDAFGPEAKKMAQAALAEKKSTSGAKEI